MATGRPGELVLDPEIKRRKRELAVQFIRRIRSMERERLHALILEEAGEELAQFFLSYANDLIDREPQRAAENASSLLLIGYLIRAFETEAKAPAPVLHDSWLH
jgi:predicted AAA+ superfamily ATPase